MYIPRILPVDVSSATPQWVWAAKKAAPGGPCPRTPEVYPPQDTRWSNLKMKDSEVLKLRCPPPFYPRLASRSLLSVALLGCLPSLDAAVCVMRLHGLFFGTKEKVMAVSK